MIFEIKHSFDSCLDLFYVFVLQGRGTALKDIPNGKILTALFSPLTLSYFYWLQLDKFTPDAIVNGLDDQ